MSNTKKQILDLAEELIRTRGYHAFSYKDISQKLDVKNAAIHYHFPTKEALGIAIIQNSINLFEKKNAEWMTYSCEEQLLDFIRIYQKSKDRKWACLMGAMSASVDALPDPMQVKLTEMAEFILNQLTNTLRNGLENSEFKFSEKPRAKAELIISSLLSSLLLDRVMKENVFDSIKQSILESVKSKN